MEAAKWDIEIAIQNVFHQPEAEPPVSPGPSETIAASNTYLPVQTQQPNAPRRRRSTCWDFLYAQGQYGINLFWQLFLSTGKIFII